MIARYFIDRPIFATVLSVLVTLAGALAVGTLPISQYPQVTPPTIQVDCNYPGASAQVVADTIAAPVEQLVNGVEDMLYMSSQCTNDGSYTCTITFKVGTNLNMSQIRVQNRVNLALPQLPDVVRATGVTTRKRSSEILLTVAMESPGTAQEQALVAPLAALAGGISTRAGDDAHKQLYLSNYALMHVRDELSRLPGISDILLFGQRDYAMRVWVDPMKLSARGLTSNDVVAALREQNLAVSAGQVGQPPAGADQLYQVTMSAVGRLRTVEEFADVVVKVGADGRTIKLKDVAAVELGARLEDVSNAFDRMPTIGLAVFLLSDANALETADLVKAHMKKLAPDLPAGLTYEIGYDTSPFIRESIGEVVKSLRDAIVLVSLVVFIFLQSWRAAAIPLAAVPVAIVGTFAAMAAVGFSLNNLTLFGLVLAVGIVVDDAIVVVEAVQHRIELGLRPREATVLAMEDVSGPIVAVGVVLSAVFVPCAFLSGIVGQFFRQFALTIAVSTLISTFNSLSLSPALCALLLKGPRRTTRRNRWRRRLEAVLRSPFALFNRAFDLSGRAYVRSVAVLLRVPLLVLAGYAGLLAAGFELYRTLPTGFIPSQDKGYLIASIQLPDAASAERTRLAIDKIAVAALSTEIEVTAREGEKGAVRDESGGAARWVRRVRPVRHVNSVAGNSFVLSAYGSNFGSMFIILRGFDERRHPDLNANAVIAALRGRLAAAVPEANVAVFGAPAVSGLGRAGGFRIMIEDRASSGKIDDYRLLQGQTENFIDRAKQQKPVADIFTAFKTNSPQVRLEVDRAACLARGLDLGEVNGVLQSSMGSRYVNDFNLFGRTWQVSVQGASQFRNEPEDLKRLMVRNGRGEMVPLGTVVVARLDSGPQVIARYNMYPAAAVNGNVGPGSSSGEAIAVLERLAAEELPPGRMMPEWTELTFIEQDAKRRKQDLPFGIRFEGDTTGVVFGVSVLFVFLVLAFLYESWTFPLAVILVVPVCVSCSLAAVWVTDPGSALESANRWAADPGLPGWLRPGEWAGRLGAWLDRGPIAALNGWAGKAGVGKQDVNIFTQVGMVVLIGLACKNAILIVEFAKVARDKGADLQAAIVAACKLRFRPILMTSVAFILGVAPLAVATGAGGEMRQALGVAVIGGMAGVTAFGIFLTPVFFALVDRASHGQAFRNRWVRAASEGLFYTAGLKFVRPLGEAVWAAANRAAGRTKPPG